MKTGRKSSVLLVANEVSSTLDSFAFSLWGVDSAVGTALHHFNSPGCADLLHKPVELAMHVRHNLRVASLHGDSVAASGVAPSARTAPAHKLCWKATIQSKVPAQHAKNNLGGLHASTSPISAQGL